MTAYLLYVIHLDTANFSQVLEDYFYNILGWDYEICTHFFRD